MDKPTNPTSVLRNANRTSIMRLLAKNGTMLRGDICKETGLTGASVSRIVRELIDCGLLVESRADQPQDHIGRHSVSLSINPNGAAVIAVTISANRRSAAVYNAAREEIDHINLEHIEFDDPQVALAAISDATQKLIRSYGADLPLVGIGVGVAAPSDNHISQEGEVVSDVLGWKNVPVARHLTKKTGLRVKVETRASAILRAELNRPSNTPTANTFLVNVGVGVGSASRIEGGFQWSGNNGFGRLSHISHPQSDVDCPCGRRGCLEHSATGAAVVREVFSIPTNQKIPFAQMGPYLAKAADMASKGDEAAQTAFFNAGQKMALGIDIVAVVLNPDAILLAGETGRQADYARGARQGLRDLRSPIGAEQLQISEARSAEGSACIGLDAFVYPGNLTQKKSRAA